MPLDALTTVVLGVAVALETYSIKEVINGKLERLKLKNRVKKNEKKIKELSN